MSSSDSALGFAQSYSDGLSMEMNLILTILIEETAPDRRTRTREKIACRIVQSFEENNHTDLHLFAKNSPLASRLGVRKPAPVRKKHSTLFSCGSTTGFTFLPQESSQSLSQVPLFRDVLSTHLAHSFTPTAPHDQHLLSIAISANLPK